MSEAWAVVEDGVVAEAHNADQSVPWWSFTKTVLASAALVLVHDGLVDLDEPLSGRPYTLRHLLQHRAGLAEYGWFPAYHDAVARGDEPWSEPELLAHVDAERLRYTPNEGWEYSNVGYLFVRRIIEAVTGENLDSALHRLILHPLGIESARVATNPEHLLDVAMGSASSYHPGWVYHGLLVGSTKDAALLLNHLLSGVLLPSETLQIMLEPYQLPGPIPDRPWQKPGYGLGMMVGETTGNLGVAGHTGGGPGSTIAVYRSLGTQNPNRTAAFFVTGEAPARTEESAFKLLRG